MKVLQVLYSGLGGHGSVVTSLVNADKKKEWEHSLLFYGIEEMLPDYKNFCIEKKIPFSFVKKNKGTFQTNWRAIRKAFKRHDPDIIILHSPSLIFPAWKYCHFWKKRLFVVEHTPHSTKRIPEKIASFFSILLASRVICLSPEYREQLQKQFRILPVGKKTNVIQNGIDLDEFKPVKKTNESQLHMGMIGRFTSQKNQVMIIDAAAIIFSLEQKEKDIHFHFAGNGNTLARIEQMVKEKKLNKVIHFHGLLDKVGIKELLAKLDVYIHASFAETMCTSVMQAMACGLPVLGSNIPGINDIVKEKDNAILFSNNDINAFIRGLLAMQDPLLRKKMGDSGRQYALLHFSAQDTFRKYNNIISSQ